MLCKHKLQMYIFVPFTCKLIFTSDVFPQVILIEFLPKYPIFRPDWGGGDRLDVWPSNLILSALYIQHVGKKVVHRCLSPQPCTSPPETCTLQLLQQRHFALEQILHIVPIDLDVSPLSQWDVLNLLFFFFFSKYMINQWNPVKKCIYPKEPSTCVPSILIAIPCKECDAYTFLNYPCLIYLFKRNSTHTRRGRHPVIQRAQRCTRRLTPLQWDGMV